MPCKGCGKQLEKCVCTEELLAGAATVSFSPEFTGSVAPGFELSKVMHKHSLSQICYALAAQVATRQYDGTIIADLAEIGHKLKQ